ncbi:metal ABC transporter substrate-binding protein [Pseudoflavonifractor phocaeensis]|uniref:metal ABC transporter substrate-binding protein n=1 Tax=Pseudoflavonifractor phocaeensis TaxID=1870988 RepID=UPI001959E002|nr:metal ABC transporter substrate-binding protein [Pseudoflavonifractor phocaeensis]MBM6924715.1 zinc ABC transporter substrate-binding protein [Pseudoflavonifractor phocaeensis]
MKKLLAPVCALALLLAGCGQPAAPAAEDDTLRVLATTYPVYLFTTAVTQGVEGVEVSLLVNQQTSCLHDYTLTVADMKAIEGADVIVMNGAGLEDFMDDALAASDAPVIDCSEGIDLLPALGHEGHDHDTEYDPHIWMSYENAAVMLENIHAGLEELDPDHGEAYAGNLTAATGELEYDQDKLAALAGKPLITFHDGFQYFAQATGLNLLKAIEEEEGAEASAAEIQEMVSLIGEYDIPAIFTEVNGSDSTAQAISRETGCGVSQLDMIMSGEGSGMGPYLEAMEQNMDTIAEALG